MSEKEVTEYRPSSINTWAIVDLFGPQQIAGLVSEHPIGGESMLRVDVPAVPGHEAFTRFYGVKAIYSLTPCSEDIARVAVERLRERPITIYGLALPEPKPADGDPYDWSDEEDEDDLDPDGAGDDREDEQELMF